MTEGRAWDDDGRVIGTTDFQYPNDEPAADDDDELRLQEEVIAELLALLTTEPNPTKCGKWVHLLAFLIHRSPYRTQAALARALRISPARVTELKRTLPARLKPLLRLRNREAVTSRRG